MKRSILQLLASFIIIFLIMYLSTLRFFRLDLTSEKRFTLSTPTRDILDTLPDVVYVKVYLTGDLPIGFLNLEDATREMLNEFRVYAGNHVQYEFINPYENNDSKERNRLFTELADKGLRPANIRVKDEEGGSSQKIVFPGALVVYKGVEFPVNLLKNNPGLSAEENLNNSVQTLEYELISAIHNLSVKNYSKIAFIEGHGELNDYQTGDITRELANFYQVDRGRINGQAGSLDNYAAIIIAKPVKRFSEADKFVIDQYIMNGGKVLWFLDGAQASMDSLVNGTTVALLNELNVEDQLFKYGVRINPDLVQDVQSALIPVNTALSGNSPNFVPVPWYYYPLLKGNQQHPVSRNLNLIKAEFASSMDTISTNPSIRKTVLLTTSELSRKVNVPVFINLQEIMDQPQRKDFAGRNLPVAILLEGTFESVFKNRLLTGIDIQGDYTFRESGKKTAIIVVSDGDIIKNEVRVTPQGPMVIPLGYDKYSGQTFGNAEFVLNAMNYLTDEAGLLSLRSREFKLRLLDRNKIHESRLFWQLFNSLGPVLIVVLTGLLFIFYRKYRYTK